MGMTLLRVALVGLGVFLALVGVWRAYWEISSWPHQCTLGLRPPIYPEGSTRVVIWRDAALSALGASLVALGALLG
jgi:hypothetical protein